MDNLPLARKVYRLHTAFVRKMNDVHIFVQQSFPLLEDARNNYESSTHKKDRRYYVPTVGRKKFARRKDRELKEIYDRFLYRELFENLVVTAISHFESFLFTVLQLVLLTHPKKLTLNVRGMDIKKEIPLNILLDANNREDALYEVIERQLNALSYAAPKAYLEYLKSVTGVDTTDPAFADYIEIKATRDVLIHNAGIVNDVYLSKVGNKNRGEGGDRLAIEKQYFNHCIATLKRLSGIIRRDIYKQFPEGKRSAG
jgi:hypothetical protein